MKKLLLNMSLVLILLTFGGCAAKENRSHTEDEEHKHGHSDDIILSTESIREVGIETSIVSLSEISGSITIPARLLANQDLEAEVGSFVEGRIKKVLVNPGDHVKKDQVLMIIEGLRIGEIKAAFIRAKAEFAYADANLKRQKTLFDQKVGSQKSLLEAQADFEKALAELDAQDKCIHSIGICEEEIEASGKNDHTSGLLQIKSPINGIVIERNVVIGQLITPGTTALRILNSAVMWADGQIYEKDLPALSGKPDITLKVSAFNELFKGKIQYIGEVVDNESRTIKVRASVDNRTKKLKPEMYCEMIIPVDHKLKGILLDSESVVRENNEFFVFIAENDSTFHKRTVKPGGTFGDQVEIREGLKPGERIASKGTFFLRSELHKEELEGHEH